MYTLAELAKTIQTVLKPPSKTRYVSETIFLSNLRIYQVLKVLKSVQ